MRVFLLLLLYVGCLAAFKRDPSMNKTSSDNSCWCPPGVYGGICQASSGVVGSPSTMVMYSIDVLSDMSVEVLILGQYILCAINMSCKWGMLDGGTFSGDQYVQSAFWGNNAGTPQIQCMSYGTGTSISWSFDAFGGCGGHCD